MSTDPKKPTTPATIAPASETQETGIVVKSFKDYINLPNVGNRFEQIMGDRAPQFTAALVQIVMKNKQLAECTYESIVGAAINAAALDLPVDPNIGHAHLVPYRNWKTKTSTCQLQIGYKGFAQLAQRSGQYHRLGWAVVHEGELVKWDELDGELILDKTKKTSDKVVGYAAKFKLLNGFERSSYWTKEEVMAHAERFSQAYGYGIKNPDKQDSPWFTDEDTMSLKTVLKDLLNRWGPLSVQMQRAIVLDQTVKDGVDAEPKHADNPTKEPKNVTPTGEPKTGSSRMDKVMGSDADDEDPYGDGKTQGGEEAKAQ